ncbi:lipopolysaccharide biosynthesis protein [Acidaminococcus massiliensis]|uniref:lipopolysaccharide biosynthesis protein n=1 Tax=Acidaminococcus massiliensis TaxID=1852375 RepID=UPI0026DD88E9|nr:lipopolysaccharide biosynthesis protein [Acidaminococcus massiliensis]
MQSNFVSTSGFLTSILKFSVSSWINFIIGILSVIITTRLFTPDIYGTLNIFNTASTFLASFACLGLDGAMLRFFNEPPAGWDKKQVFTKCLLFSVLFLFILTSFSSVFYYRQISLALFNRISLFFTVLLSMNALSMMVLNNYYSQYYRLDNDSFHYTVQTVLVQFFSKLFVVTAAFLSPTADTVLAFNTSGLFVLMVIYSFIQRKSIWPSRFHWSNQGFGEVFRYGLWGWPLSMAFSASGFLIPFIIKIRMDSYALGIFASTGFFVTAFNVVQSGFRTYWAAFMYAHYKTEQKRIIEVHDYIIIFVIALLSCFLILQHVAYLFIGKAFQSSRLFFSLVLLDPLIILLEQTTNYGMALAKRNQEMTAIYLLAIALYIILAYMLIPFCGLPGVAVAAAAASVIRFTLATWRGQYYYKSIKNIKKTMVGIILLIALGISNYIFNEQYLWELVFIVAVWLIMYFCFKDTFRSMARFIKSGLPRLKTNK